MLVKTPILKLKLTLVTNLNNVILYQIWHYYCLSHISTYLQFINLLFFSILNINLKEFTILILLLIKLQVCFGKIDLDFSHKRGYFTSPFSLIIEADDPNAIIKYTTNSTKPSINNGYTYNGSINITNSTVVRVFAYSANDVSNNRAHSYIFLNDVINDSYMYDYITQDNNYAPLMETSFKALPVISLTSNQINGTNHIDTEIETAVEMFFPDNSRAGFMVHSGIQTWGGSPTNPKKHYRLEFKEIYGTKKLDYKIFKADNYDNTIYGIPPAEKFNKLVLRGGSQDGLNAEYGAENLAQYVRNRYFMDTQMEMGYPAPHGRFVHVFVNLDYVGQYHLMERPDVDFFQSYYGGLDTDYEVYKSGEYWDDLNLNLWGALPNRINLSSASAIQNTNNYIDLNQTAAYLNIMSYGSAFDWGEAHNCLGGTNINAGNGGYKFIVWDMDFNFGNGGKWNPSGTSINYFGAPLSEDGPVPDNLVNNIEFKYMMADNVECTCYNNGILTPNIVDSLYMHRINQVTTSLIAESARWGDYNFTYVNGTVQDALWDVNDEFTAELNRVRNNWIPQRTNYMLNYYENNELKSDLQAVGFSAYGGKVDQNFTLTLSNNNSSSKIYYTLDGSDPRSFGGSIANNAIQYNGPISLPAGPVTVKARVRDDFHSNNDIRKWSAMCPRTFYVNQNYEDIVINEIHYNPQDSIFYNPTLAANDTVSGKSFEFVELKNTGSDMIYLQDVHFEKGITLTFKAPLVILPDSFIVVAENANWFQKRYGFSPDAVYTGKLANSGETLALQAPCNTVIDSVSYSDVLPWDTIPDNGTYSLALIDDLTDNTLASNWSKQSVSTTPGSTNIFCTPITVSSNIFDISCNAANDGIIINNISGGALPYSYSWANGATTKDLSNLAAGNYTLTITDKFGCKHKEDFIINQPAQLASSATFTNETYFQANDGTASITISGGTSPYTYAWSNNQTTASISNLTPGTYTVQVTDANGCSIDDTVNISAIDCSTFDAQIIKTDETYFQTNDGSATINITNGTTPYAYLWSNGDTTSNINNLAPNNYSVDVTDALGCSLSIPFTVNAIDCSNFTTQISSTNETANQYNDGAASVTTNGGTAPYFYSWSTGDSTSNIIGLSPNSYSVDITDSKGCTQSNSVTILPYVCQNLAVDVDIVDETCLEKSDGLIIINSIQNGTAPYGILWDSGINGTVNNNLTSGTYTLEVTDAKNCPFSGSYNIVSQSNINPSYAITDESAANANDGIVNLSVLGGITPYSYSWSNGKTTQDIANAAPGLYDVTITDANNCVTIVDNIEVMAYVSTCPISLIETNNPNISNTQIKVVDYIQTNALIGNGNIVNYKAGNYIELMDSFEVKQGASFEAIIENCN